MELFEFSFFRNALLGVMLISVASALIGTYIVTRRQVLVCGGITHACFGGLGLGYMLGWNPLAMAAVFAVSGSLGAEWMTARRVRSDSAIAVIWALGMALGVLFVFLTAGYVPELNSFLFGNVLTITLTDIYLFAALLAAVALIYLLFYHTVLAISFDADFARTRRLPVSAVNTLMSIMVALTIVLTIRMVGIMLLMSMLSLPQIGAELFARRYRAMLLLSGVLSLIGSVGGLFIAYAISVPASAAIVLLMVVIYALCILSSRLCARLC